MTTRLQKLRTVFLILTVSFCFSTCISQELINYPSVLGSERQFILETTDTPFMTILKIGIDNKIINNKTPRDSLLLLFPNSRNINDTTMPVSLTAFNDTTFNLYLPEARSSFNNKTIYFDSFGKIKEIVMKGDHGTECCNGSPWVNTIQFRNNMIFYTIDDFSSGFEKQEIEWNPSHSFLIIKRKEIGYSKFFYTYKFKKKHAFKVTVTELRNDKVYKKIKYTYYFKKT